MYNEIFVKFVIKKIGENKFLNWVDDDTIDLNDAVTYDSIDEAIKVLESIDVAYLYEISKVKITYEIE